MFGFLLFLVGRLNVLGGEDKVRDIVVDIFIEIVSKKMKVSDKIEMINFLQFCEIIIELLVSFLFNEWKGIFQYDMDLVEVVVKFVNVIMLDIVCVFEDGKVDNDMRVKVEQFL